MAFKSRLVSYLFGCVKTAAEHGPAMAESAAVSGTVSLVYPLAILAAPLIDIAAEHLRDARDPHDLAELYRESMREALKTCVESCRGMTDADQSVSELWEEGLKVPVKGDPLWEAILEDSMPTRMLSANPRGAPSNWPLLRAQLQQWTNWFRYRRTSGSAPGGFDIPRQPLKLSREFEAHLAANLARELLNHFQSELVSGHHRDAFNQTLLRKLDELDRQLRPLDPVLHVDEFPKPEDANTALKLLDTKYRVAPYVGRRADLDSLWTWLAGDGPLSFQVVVGRGGKGKTRLAYQLLEEIEETQPYIWHAGLLGHERFEAELKNEAFRRWRARKPTLIVIDYADQAAPLLEKYIVPEMARLRPGKDDPPLRFLLLARTADPTQGWYKSLRSAAGSSENDLFPNTPLVLTDLDFRERRELVGAMLRAAARVEGGARLSLPPAGADKVIDARLAAEEFADPLVLSMAAIVAHGEHNLNALHLHRTDLARGMAKRERRRLEKLAADGAAAFLVHMAAYVSLAGRVSYEDLERVIEEERGHFQGSWPIGGIADILAPDGTAEPIPLDIIAEAFVYDVLHERAQHGAETVPRAARWRTFEVTRGLVRAVQDFEPDPARPSEGDEPCQAWALERLTAALAAHASAISDSVFWEIHAALPEQTVAMIPSVLGFYRAVCQAREVASDPVGLAALVSYAIFESRAGRRPEALAAIQEAVKHYRELAGKNREAFLPDLAMSLNNQANRQSEMGQRAEALESIQEAVKHYRELAGKNREAFLPDLAQGLGTWGSVMLAAESPTAAAEKFAEGVRLITPLAQELPQAHFRLALQLAQHYRRAAEAAGIDPDSECLWPLEVMRLLVEQKRQGEEPESTASP
jgi:tetratricopeptide (TPR) repeat protein